MPGKKLKIAVQKSGRLSEDSINLLKKCGIKFNNGLGKLKSEAENFPLEIFFCATTTFPNTSPTAWRTSASSAKTFWRKRECGRRQSKNSVSANAACRSPCRKISLTIQSKISTASASPRVTRKFWTSFSPKKKITAEIHTISGSVEIAPSIGLADAVCDLVSSGSTLFTNGLREVETVMNSEAVLDRAKKSRRRFAGDSGQTAFRIKAVKAARQNKYILLNAPNEKLNEIIALLPGIKSPTVMPLAEGGWSSVHSVINENDFWEIVEQLKKGAEGILVLSIDQMIQ
jgi:ATP phosphoribosyltransferase